MLKLCFGSVLACFRFPKNAASTSKKLPLPSNKRNNHKNNNVLLSYAPNKKEQYYEKIDFKCFDSSDDILVC